MDLSPTDIELPGKLLPDLSEWGILDAVDRGICPDTFENRKLIRANRARWQEVFDADGNPTSLIRVITSDMLEALRTTNRAALLADQSNPDSEFVTGYDLLLDDAARDLAPSWVTAATRHYMHVEDERDKRGPNGKPYRPALVSYPHRCKATSSAGTRCFNWCNGTVDMNGLCKMHLANHRHDPEAGTNTLVKARNRLISAAVGAVDELENLMNTATSEPVRAQAAKEILDRAGIRGGVEIEQKVEITVKPASELVAERLAKLAQGAIERQKLEEARYALESANSEEEVVDAEVVE